MKTRIDDPQEGGCQLEKEGDRPSLLSYLHPADGRFLLKMSMKEGSRAVTESSHSPFLVISDADPFFRLIEASIVTDGGSEVRRVFLMLQKEEVGLSRDDLRPITNRDIDEAWQKAFSFYSREGQDPSVHVLSQQVNRSGVLIPFQPLFFCKTRGLFFHPLCPRCGSFLEQCYDGPLLSRWGLQPYATSLRRYLFCHPCSQKGDPDFYVYEIHGSDPAPVKDRWQLIKGFGSLASGDVPAVQFPCSECVDRQGCYGPDQKALLRIVPFSFYPFYLFVLEGMTLHATDFLALASGASFEELERHLKAKGEFGRARCVETLHRRGLKKIPFFFDQKDEFFLEILYLKLSFLGQLMQGLGMDRKKSPHPGLRPSIHSIWVKTPEPDGLLPFFWNFKAIPFDVVRDPKEAGSFPGFPDFRDDRFLGLIWLYALLANRRQDLPAVYSALKEVFGQVPQGESPSFEGVSGPKGPGVFRPENIFWNPGGRDVEKRWNPLWERAIKLGGVLLGAGGGKDTPSREAWWKDWEELRDAVKEGLFHREVREERVERKPEISSGRENGPPEDAVIYGILAGVLKKWGEGLKPPTAEMAETLILRVDELKETGTRRREEEIAETVVLSGGAVRRAQDTGRVKEEVASAGGGHAPASTMNPQPPQDDFMAETVILKPRRETAKNTADALDRAPAAAKTKEQPEEDLMAETVILGPAQRQKKRSDGNKE